MAVIEFAAYAQAHSERDDGRVVGDWHDTAYARALETARIRKREQAAAYRADVWARVQYEAGIRRIMDIWGAERWDEYDEHLNPTGSTRRGLGVLWQHRSYPEEVAALDNIDCQAVAYVRAGGRTSLTETEAWVWQKERYYMEHCQTREFASRYPKHAAAPYHFRPQNGDEHENTIDERLCHAWIAMQTQIPAHIVKDILANVASVYELRESLDLDGDAPIRRDNALADAA